MQRRKNIIYIVYFSPNLKTYKTTDHPSENKKKQMTFSQLSKTLQFEVILTIVTACICLRILEAVPSSCTSDQVALTHE